ncbi:MAG: hypothetical protein AB8B61_09105 [Cyclobacteriaceae bacterium]
MNRKDTVLFILFLFSITLSLQAQIVMKGRYAGRNIYVQNIPNKLVDTVEVEGFCVDSVFVNDSLALLSPQTTSFEVNLERFKEHEKIKIRITHKENCTPSVLNKNDIGSGLQFKFDEVFINDHELKWFTEGEEKEAKYIIKHFWSKKWVVLDTVDSKGQGVKSGYRLPIHNTSGDNEYEIIYYIDDKEDEMTKVEYYAHKRFLTYYPKRVRDFFTFSEKTMYEIYDKNGKKLLLKGVAEKVDCSSLKGKNSTYLVLYDNRVGQFLKQ